MTQQKTDNHDPRAKLALRRHFLARYHADAPAHVLDCCMGSGLLWTTLRNEFAVASYWGVDLKPKKGRLKIDSVRILAQPGWTQDVVDVDTYGHPWKHWLAILANISRPTTVFLTIGQVSQMGGTNLSRELKTLGGLGQLNVPPAMNAKIVPYLTLRALAQAADNCTILEAVEAVSDGNARYVGVRLEPRKETAAKQVPVAKRPVHSKL